ncbi:MULTISPECIES: rhomboid family intramembrane serine protease [unclassified Mycolicibacterium]|jgi:membrane associated rhomboid family serine protease|uniref:rhomboid family intramembrane serine protease n=1 Tax=unclassified Mycolicibacterium TaxID=2636767 RepID=UPI00224B8663|nr:MULTISPECIES: rhomboid family intramembrane serine protease [unclassified Mycolicibacterium]MCX2715659.1 rhomboid family intramembrane serine protease [Mycolicibacterium sp. J2]MDX1870842.1 rhomboid family intramembrane serine protease [Mycolicibacterium sp. 120266]
MTVPPQQVPPQAPVCYRHPNRPSYIQCTRCGRYICPDCMRDAAVGHQCVECVNAGAATVRQAEGRFGGRPAGDTPYVTYTLIAINVLMFVLQVAAPDIESRLTLWPPAVASGEYYRLVTSAFLHYGLAHILFNMWALYVIGPPLERLLGQARYATLYGLSALGGSVLVFLIAPLNTATAGASGAVFGLFGATFVVARKLRLDVKWVVGLIVLNLAFTFVGPLMGSGAISWQGHLGGLLTGGVVSAGLVYAPRAQRNLIQTSLAVGLLALFAVLIWWRSMTLLSMFGGYLHGG